MDINSVVVDENVVGIFTQVIPVFILLVAIESFAIPKIPPIRMLGMRLSSAWLTVFVTIERMFTLLLLCVCEALLLGSLAFPVLVPTRDVVLFLAMVGIFMGLTMAFMMFLAAILRMLHGELEAHTRRSAAVRALTTARLRRLSSARRRSAE